MMILELWENGIVTEKVQSLPNIHGILTKSNLVARYMSIFAENTIDRMHEHHLHFEAQKNFKNQHYLLFFWRAPHMQNPLARANRVDGMH